MKFIKVNAPERLKELRRERNITLRNLAEEIGISPTRLCRIEKGERIPEPECARAICEALGLSKEETSTILFSFGYIELDD